MTETISVPKKIQLSEVKKELARRNHLRFMKYCWRKKEDEPFIIGFHTRKICERIDKAIEDFKKGKSTFIRIAIHPRAGKSDIVSRYLPAHFVGMFPDKEVIQASFSGAKAKEFSRFGRSLFKSKSFSTLFPNVSLSKEVSSAGEWMVLDEDKDLGGRVFSSGYMAGLAGSGYHLGILDDYCGSVSSARSQVQRDGMWEAFTTDFLTRRSSISITIILATQWDMDDIHGRIEKKNDPQDEEYDPLFPKFEYMAFPAMAEDYAGEGEYSNKYLFMERYSEEWYKQQYSSLSSYYSSAMFDCSPILKTGNILKTDSLVYHEKEDDFPTDIKYFRVWDYAHTAKERSSIDPDYTGGTLIGFKKVGYNAELKMPEIEIWIKHYIQFREGALERDKRIVNIAKNESSKRITVLIEASLDSMDGASYLKNKIGGLIPTHLVKCKGDKVVRCTPVEPVFELGRVHVLRGEWNKIWLKGIQSFDGSGKSHDEMVDNITCAYQHYVVGSGYKKLDISWG
jgi:predicted phage terminase large subunit-like protein